MTTKRRTLHVVIVGDHRPEDEVLESGAADGKFAAFIGTNLNAVVALARESSRYWGESRVDGKPYRLLAGKLTGVIKPISEFTVEAL